MRTMVGDDVVAVGVAVATSDLTTMVDELCGVIVVGVPLGEDDVGCGGRAMGSERICQYPVYLGASNGQDAVSSMSCE